MTNNQRFDEHIKEQFNNYAPDVHPGIWKNIAAKKDNRKPVGFWFGLLNSRNIFILMGILIAGGTGAFLLTRKAQDNDKNKIVTTANNVTATTSIGSDNSTVLSNTTTSNPADVNNNTTIATVTPTTTSGNNVTTTRPDASLPVTNFSKPAQALTHSPFFGSDVLEGPVAYNKKVSKNNRKLNIKITEGQLNENDYEQNAFNSDILEPGGTILNRLSYGAERIAATKKMLKGPIVPNLFGSLPDCPSLEKNAAGNKKYLEFYAGPDFAFRSLKDTGNSVYLQKRKESSKFTSAYSVGVRYTKVFNSGMSVRAGVNYSQINEKFKYVQGNLVQVTYIINANGDTTGSYVTTGTRYKTTHNKYRSVDIPVMIGYEMGNGRIHANFNVGPVINIYSWQKGEILDTSFLPVNISTGKGTSPYQFKTNAGIGFIGAVSVYYKLNDKIHVMAEPYYRHNFSQMNKENLTLKQKYNTIGLKVGVRIDLR